MSNASFTSKVGIENEKKKKKKKRKLRSINSGEKFILLPQEKRHGPRLKVSSERLLSEIDILIRSPIPKLTKLDVSHDCLES